MVGGYQLIHDAAKVAVVSSVGITVEEIAYRQHLMTDAIHRPAVLRDIYNLAGEAIARKKQTYFGLFRDSPETLLNRSIEVMTMFAEVLRRLRQIADQAAPGFRSAGFRTLFEMPRRELSEDYFKEVSANLKRLKFPDFVFVSARLGAGFTSFQRTIASGFCDFRHDRSAATRSTSTPGMKPAARRSPLLAIEGSRSRPALSGNRSTIS